MAKIKKRNVGSYGFKELFKYYKRHIGFFIGYIIVLVISAVLNFMEAMFAANMIAAIMDSFNYDLALKYALWVMIVCVVNAILHFINTFFL